MSAAQADPGGPATLGPSIQLGIVFDLDGTLVDSRLDIAGAANHALGACGFTQLSVEEISTFVGDGASLLMARAARLDPEAPRLEALLEAFLSYYAAHATDHTTLLPGAHEALAALRHLPLALCTNKTRSTTDAVLANLRFPAEFKVVVAAGDLAQNKPHPLPLQHIARLFGLSTAQLVMVGDGPQDILCAKAAGSRSVGVEGGIQGRERLIAANPDFLLQSLAELPRLVASWLGEPTDTTPVSP
jgi:phosphoglycolate phosphatase